MKKVVIFICLLLMVGFSLTIRGEKVSAAENPVILESVDIYGPNSFSYTPDALPLDNIINFGDYFYDVFSQGGNASWQYTIEIVFSNYLVNSFTMLVENLWEWDSNYDSVSIDTDNESLVFEEFPPPNIITRNNFINKQGYVLSVYITSFGYNLVDLVLSFQNDGFTQGYDSGYTQGYNKGAKNGFNEGYIKGETDGFNNGYEKGFREGSESENDLYSMVLAVVDTPFTIFDYIFDFNVLGINIKNIILSFATIAIAVFVIKKFI